MRFLQLSKISFRFTTQNDFVQLCITVISLFTYFPLINEHSVYYRFMWDSADKLSG